jgi:hypothetical protein
MLSTRGKHLRTLTLVSLQLEPIRQCSRGRLPLPVREASEGESAGAEPTNPRERSRSRLAALGRLGEVANGTFVAVQFEKPGFG